MPVTQPLVGISRRTCETEKVIRLIVLTETVGATPVCEYLHLTKKLSNDHEVDKC